MSGHLNHWIEMAHPIKEIRPDQEHVLDFCHVYEDFYFHVQDFFNTSDHEDRHFDPPPIDLTKTMACEVHEHNPKYVSIITQFNLYCSREILIATTQFFHLFGVLCGGIVATNLMKCIDPKSVMMIGYVTQIMCGNLTGWAKIFELHMIFRCLSAVCCGLQYTAGGLICKFEFVLNKVR